MLVKTKLFHVIFLNEMGG